MMIDIRLDNRGHAWSLDESHCALLVGMILAMKPKRVLDLGVGPGFTSAATYRALQINGCGTMTCVDNCAEREAADTMNQLQILETPIVIRMDERAFLGAQPDNLFDILISDADHDHSHEWLDEHIRVNRGGGIMLFHDVCNPDYPKLATITERLQHLNPMLFTESTIPGERCGRGWLVVRNRK
jgi:predicted O-methyltransferase YrrM